MKLHHLVLAVIITFSVSAFAAEPPPKPKGPAPAGERSKGGPGGNESAEMKALLESFKLTDEQKAKYDAAKKKTGEEMRAISVGKKDGSMPMDEVLKRALASHKAFNAEVKTILSPEQYDKWLPLREADHSKIAKAHKERDEAAAKAKAPQDKSGSK